MNDLSFESIWIRMGHNIFCVLSWTSSNVSFILKHNPLERSKVSGGVSIMLVLCIIEMYNKTWNEAADASNAQHCPCPRANLGTNICKLDLV